MSDPFIVYTTRDGDRWDLIAWEMYGDALAFEPIIAANPDVAITPELAGGIKLRIPVRAPLDVASASLPPWKRA